MYEILPSFALGFHGCERAVAEKIFSGRSTLKASQNAYDWLGHGIYFWENNPDRALEWAEELMVRMPTSRRRIKEPAVVGAIIDLGHCLNLLDSQFIRKMRAAYEKLSAIHVEAGIPLPANKAPGGSKDLLLRYLDCAVIEMIHEVQSQSKLPPFDSVRGVFLEGSEVYPGAGVREQNHIQICVRNSGCIKGYFRVLKDPGPNTP